MKIADALQNVTYLFLDSAPVIYYVEKHPLYSPLIVPILDLVDNGALAAVVSPVTLAECLVVPLRTASAKLQEDFSDLLTGGPNTVFASIDAAAARSAAEFRARYNLNFLDALQIAVALNAGCEALLTNDAMMKRVTELRIVVVDELEL